MQQSPGRSPSLEVTEKQVAAAAKPLRGITVLDLTNVLSGPFCTYQLGLLGAEVIKIEPPRTGDLARQLGADEALNKELMGASFLAQNAGKRSITLNLKSVDGCTILRKLIERADVLVENFRPGVMKRLGFSHDRCREINSKLIYCSISGFGQDGPMAQNPAYDQIVQGLSGIMSVTGSADSAPLRVGFPVCDTIGGLTAAFAITTALVGRNATGEGSCIDVSMLDSTVVALGWVVSNFLMAGTIPAAMGNENMTAAPSGAFETKDGLLNIAANKQEQFEQLCQLIERHDLIRDPRFARRDQRKLNRKALKAEIETALVGRPAAYWEKLLNEHGIPAGRVLDVPQVLSSPQITHRDLLKNLGPINGSDCVVQVVGTGFRFTDGAPAPAGLPPLLGQHTDDILATLGYAPSDVDRFKREGAV